MNKEFAVVSQFQIETRRLDILLKTSEVGLDFFIHQQVENSGYIIQNKKRAPLPDRNWLILDYDDTLAAYTRIKQERSKLLEAYFLRLGIKLEQSQMQQIINATDQFSRWCEDDGEGVIYHPNAHLMSLQWVIDSLLQKTSDNEIDKVIEELLRKLAELHSSGYQNGKSDMPFYLRCRDKKLVKKNGNKLWSRELEDIFLHTVLDPPPYEDLVFAIEEIQNQVPPDQITNIGIFTFGDPYGQLFKILGFLKRNPDFPLTQIWIARRDKGSFLKERVELDDSFSRIVFDSSRQITIIDDNPIDLASIATIQSIIPEDASLLLKLICSKRKGTKNYNSRNRTEQPISEIDFDTDPHPLTTML